MLTPCRVKVRVAACVAAAALSLLLPARAAAQSAPTRALTVTVTDKEGGLVTGLQRESFTVLDGGRPSEIVSFASGDMPATVGVLLDASGSVAGRARLGPVREALLRFFNGCHPSDEFFFIAFNVGPQLIQGMTNDPEKVLDAIDKYVGAVPRGRTAFYDAVYLGLNQAARGRHAKRALVILSDGQDNNSHYRFEELRRQLKESDVIVYAVGVASTLEDSALDYGGRAVLEELAGMSGGRVFYPESERDLNAAFEDLAKELRNQYVIGFAPASAGKKDGWHEVRVRLSEVRAGGKKVKAVARARAGFYDVPPKRRD